MCRPSARRVGTAVVAVCLAAACGDVREVLVESTTGRTDTDATTDADDMDTSAAGSTAEGSTGLPEVIGVCDSPVAMIPDGSADGFVVSLDVDAPGSSLAAVALRIQHDFVGQLRAVVRHEGVTVTLVDHPSGGGCSGGGLEARFLDGAERDVDGACDSTDGPAIGGDVRPLQPLSAFEGVPMQGAWELVVVDDTAEIQGHLDSWCVIMNP